MWIIIIIVNKHHSKKSKPLLKLISNTLFKNGVKTTFYPFLGWFIWQKKNKTESKQITEKQWFVAFIQGFTHLDGKREFGYYYLSNINLDLLFFTWRESTVWVFWFSMNSRKYNTTDIGLDAVSLCLLFL